MRSRSKYAHILFLLSKAFVAGNNNEEDDNSNDLKSACKNRSISVNY